MSFPLQAAVPHPPTFHLSVCLSTWPCSCHRLALSRLLCPTELGSRRGSAPALTEGGCGTAPVAVHGAESLSHALPGGRDVPSSFDIKSDVAPAGTLPGSHLSAHTPTGTFSSTL